MDIQGPAAVAPWVDRHKVGFPVAVDAADVFGTAFGLTAIPVSYLVDEVGIIRIRGAGPSPEFLAEIEKVLREPVSRVRGSLPSTATTLAVGDPGVRAGAEPIDVATRIALARSLQQAGDFAGAIAACEAAARVDPANAVIPFHHGLVLLGLGRTNDALIQLRRARDLAPDNWRIRKQIWAIEHPDRFYGSEGIDWAWQKEQLRRERP